MEEVLDNQLSSSGLTVSSIFKNNLQKQAYWARLLGIGLMVMYGIFLLLIIFGGSVLLSLLTRDVPGGMGGFGTVILIIYAAIILFSLYMSYLTFNFGRKTLFALNNDDQYSLEEGSANLGRIFKITGIMMAILIAFYGIAILIALLGGGMAALAG